MKKNTRTIVTPEKGERYIRMATPNNDVDLVADLACCILSILENPKTPVALWNAVAHWTTDATNIKNQTGDSLLSAWSRQPATIAACIKWANEADDLQEMAEATQARNGGAQ